MTHGHAGFRRGAAHPSVLGSPTLVVVTVALSILGAIVGLQVLTTLGITPNTSLIGVLAAIALSRVPLGALAPFRSVHVQNLAQTAISSASFGAANALLLPMGIPVLLGRPDLALPMLAGAALAMVIDLAMLYWLFDSRLFPASAAWPHGRAAAEAIRAGDEGGWRAKVLVAGGAIGLAGASGLFGAASRAGLGGVPMSAFGVAFIGNAAALGAFAVGLLIAGLAPGTAGIDLAQAFIPHGVMVGAGLAALGQALFIVLRHASAGRITQGDQPTRDAHEPTRSDDDVRRALGGGVLLYVIAAVMLAAASGLLAGMSVPMLAAWVAFAAFACVSAELVVGFSAMHAGWFPAFATALIFLVLALALGFPADASALLVGFVAAGSPAFADAGYDLEAGWVLRRAEADPAFERDGRRQQILAGAVGLLTALVMVAWVHDRYFAQDLFPPIDRVYVATIRAGIEPGVVGQLLLWALPGAALQLLGGLARQLGILFATGLLVAQPLAGAAVFVGLALRWGLARRAALEDEAGTAVLGAGCIAGDALWGFVDSVMRTTWR